MNSWPKIKLGDLCDIVAGSTPDSKNSQYWNGDINWVTPAEMKRDSIFIEATERRITQAGFDSCSTKLFPKGAVILSTRAPIGKVAIAATEMCSNQGIKSLIPKPEKLDSFYLYWWLKDHTDYLNSLGSGATFKELSMTVLKSIQIPVPPIDVQKKIAKTLNACHDLKKQREEADSKMATFAPALFHQMFGDPVKNEKGWELKKLASLIEFDKRTYDADGTLPYIGLEDIESGTGRLISTHEKAQIKSKVFRFQQAQILYAKLRPNLNKVILSKIAGQCSTELVPIKLKDSTVNEWLFQILISDWFVREAMRSIKGANLPRADLRALLDLEIATPPVELQKQFAERISGIQKLQEKQEDSRLSLAKAFESITAMSL